MICGTISVSVSALEHFKGALIFEHARLVFVSNEIRVHVCVLDVLTNVARTFFTSCQQVHCLFLISRMIRFLMQELLALAGLSCWSSLEGDY